MNVIENKILNSIDNIPIDVHRQHRFPEVHITFQLKHTGEIHLESNLFLFRILHKFYGNFFVKQTQESAGFPCSSITLQLG